MFFWWFTACAALHSTVVQGTYDVMIEDVTCSEVNKEYITACEFESNYDSTYGANLDTYIEIIKPFPDNTKLLINMLTVQMGEYSVDTGLKVESNFCELLRNKTAVGIPILKAINMDGDSCPPKPGIYQQENYVVDSPEGLPPTFPSGPYLVNMTLINKDSVIMHLDIYIRVY